MSPETESSIRKDIVAGNRVRDICEKHDISRSTVHRLKKKMVEENGTKPEEKTPVRPDNPILRSDAIKFITKRKKGFTVDALAKKLDIHPVDALKVIQHLSHHDGYNLIQKGVEWKLIQELPPMKPLKLDVLLGKEFKFGIVSDNHLCSKYSRLDVLEAAYDCFEKEGITTVLNAGNMIDGEFRFNMYEIVAHGVHDQSLYVADHYPQRKGIQTFFVTGTCHEGWYQDREGVKIGWYIQKVCEERGRNDLIHIGHIEQDVLLRQEIDCTRIRLMHPGGGTPYALSYPSQKMVESFQGGDKPHVLIMGHYHKFDFNYQREVLCIMAGCTQDQTPFMRKKKLAAHVGFTIVTLGLRADGTIGRSGVEFFPFYDAKYHRKINEYELKG